ncbi:hypothetical protein CLU85_2930 [Acidovorax sp. 69]|uniref:hypothetical protein n=1 Tax=Acidovorax sp. 69 TaxID=2035202 RepID=UPI000C2457EF|nr:hypothetical protein [Acidovorax sp. 69]PJI98125.1 hypothetical protein CLU85_2930 [Acidovorax sp. 69]
MRRGFYILLMVVLVLRGLTGTAMAAGVLPPLQPLGEPHGYQQEPPQSHHHGSTLSAAATTSQPDDNGHNNHPGMSAQATTETEGKHAHGHDYASTAPTPSELTVCDGSTGGCTTHDHHTAACSACEICHSAMLNAPAAVTSAHLPPGALQPLATAQFDSAAAALAIKPPIA